MSQVGRPSDIKPGSSIMGSKWRVAYAMHLFLTTFGKSKKKAAQIVFVAFVDPKSERFKSDIAKGEFKLSFLKHNAKASGHIRLSASIASDERQWIDIDGFHRQLKRLDKIAEQRFTEIETVWLERALLALALLFGKDIFLYNRVLTC